MRRKKRRKKSSPAGFIILLIMVLVVVFGCQIYRKRYAYSKEKADLRTYLDLGEEEAAASLMVQNELSEYKARIWDGVSYLSLEAVHRLLNDRFYYGAADGVVLYSLPAETVSTVVGTSEWTSETAGTVAESYPLTRMEGDTLYLALDFVRKYTDFTYQSYTDPNRIQMYNRYEPMETAVLKKNTDLRVTGGVKSKVVASLEKDARVWPIEKMEKWAKIRTQDGLYGYVENKVLKDEKTEEMIPPADAYQEPEFSGKPFGKKVSLVWHAIGAREANAGIGELLSSVKGVNVVSPTWFSVRDEAGNVSDISAGDYVADMHSRGIAVWPAVDNFTAAGSMQKFLTTSAGRKQVIDHLMASASALGFDGINVDLEGIDASCGEDYIQFIRELSIRCRKQNLTLSVDNYVPYAYNDHYELKEQGKFADYIIVMGYDEHYAGSAEAGSVASIGYVSNGIESALSKVPADKLINAIPFYTRVWKNAGGQLTSSAVGMADAERFVTEKGLHKNWDEGTGQNYAEGALEDGTLVQIWLEDADSVKTKLSVMQQHELAGVAAWRLGFETANIWNVIAEYMAQ